MTHWARQYIGLPWTAGGQGPRSFSCWGLVQHCASLRLACALPAATHGQASMEELVSAAVAKGWQRVEGLMQEDDIVLMRRLDGQRHCGYVVLADGKLGVLHADGFLHRSRGAVGGVVFQSLEEATSSGYGQYRLWRFKQ